MSHQAFIDYYTVFLEQNSDLREALDAVVQDERAFVELALEQGKANGFEFTEDEVRDVMVQSRKALDAELSNTDLDEVAGGSFHLGQPTFGTVKIRSFNLGAGSIPNPPPWSR